MGAALLPKMLADSIDRDSAFLYLFLNLLGTQRNPSLSNVFKMDGQQADPRRTGGRRAHPAPFYPSAVRFPLGQNKNGARRTRSGSRRPILNATTSLLYARRCTRAKRLETEQNSGLALKARDNNVIQ